MDTNYDNYDLEEDYNDAPVVMYTKKRYILASALVLLLGVIVPGDFSTLYGWATAYTIAIVGYRHRKFKWMNRQVITMWVVFGFGVFLLEFMFLNFVS